MLTRVRAEGPPQGERPTILYIGQAVCKAGSARLVNWLAKREKTHSERCVLQQFVGGCSGALLLAE